MVSLVIPKLSGTLSKEFSKVPKESGEKAEKSRKKANSCFDIFSLFVNATVYAGILCEQDFEKRPPLII